MCLLLATASNDKEEKEQSSGHHHQEVFSFVMTKHMAVLCALQRTHRSFSLFCYKLPTILFFHVLSSFHRLFSIFIFRYSLFLYFIILLHHPHVSSLFIIIYAPPHQININITIDSHSSSLHFYNQQHQFIF